MRRAFQLYRRSRYHKAGQRRVGKCRRWLLLCVFSMVLLSVYVEIKLPALRPELQQAALQSYAQEHIAETVEPFLSGNAAFSDETLVSLDTYTLNCIKSDLTLELQKALAGKAVIWVPLGNLTGLSLLNGHGIKIPVVFTVEGAADIQLVSALSAAGINRTQYRVDMVITVELFCSSTAYPDTVTVTTGYPVYETVQEGEVPQFYSGIHTE